MLTVAVHNMLTCISRRLRQVPSQSCGKYRPSHSKYEHGCSRYAHVYIEDTKESTEPCCCSQHAHVYIEEAEETNRPRHSKYEHVVQCCCSQHAHVYIEEAEESTEPVTRNMNM
ncbi:hypothetical protein J6590_067236 [Homalodisca vitripennis]|nr:hypothetical protein J6590_067236 [Homalodisca vitripennis]